MLVMNWARSQEDVKYLTTFSRKWNEMFLSSLETSYQLTLYSFLLVRRRMKWSRVLISDRMKYLSYLMVRLTPCSMIKWLWIQIKSLQQRRNFEYVTINLSPKPRLGRTDQWGPEIFKQIHVDHSKQKESKSTGDIRLQGLIVHAFHELGTVTRRETVNVLPWVSKLLALKDCYIIVLNT